MRNKGRSAFSTNVLNDSGATGFFLQKGVCQKNFDSGKVVGRSVVLIECQWEIISETQLGSQMKWITEILWISLPGAKQSWLRSANLLQGPVRFYDNERKANIMLKQFQSKYTKYLQNLEVVIAAWNKYLSFVRFYFLTRKCISTIVELSQLP